MPDAEEVLSCPYCGQAHLIEPLKPGTKALCRRCGSTIRQHTSASLHWTAAFSLAALLLYAPANMFPIMRMYLHGASSDNTVWKGCVLLFRDGQWGIAVIVFLASIFIPLLKLLGLFFLVITRTFKVTWLKLQRVWVYRVIEGVGRWAMLDVFVMAILVALVKLQRLATIKPGPGLVAFTGVVVCTLLASASFEPQTIWESKQELT